MSFVGCWTTAPETPCFYSRAARLLANRLMLHLLPGEWALGPSQKANALADLMTFCGGELDEDQA
jgi:hypothetical protein